MATSGGGDGMPLSEDEQRILSEIESHLYESDPGLAREVAETTVYSHAFRNSKWAVLGLVAGLIIMVLTFSVHFMLAFIGVLVMFGSLIHLERNLRRAGKAGIGQVSQSMADGGFKKLVGNAGTRMRERFDRNGDSPN